MASVSFDLNRFRWRKDDKVPGRFLREPVGGELIEDVWNMVHYGEQNLFLGLYLELTQPLSPSDFLAHVRDAWISLRWEVPAIATQGLHIMEEGRPLPRPYMVYDLAKSAADVAAWAEETAILVEGYKDLDDLRYVIGQEPVPAKDLSPWTYAYVLPTSPKSFGVLIRTSHVPFDGTGLKNSGTKLLTHLSNYIADPSYRKSELERLKWGSELEAANLLPAFLNIIEVQEPQAAVKDAQGNIIQEACPGEKPAGPLFDKTFGEVMQGLAKGAALSHPFKSIINPPFDLGKQKPKTRRLYHTFSVEESTKIKDSGAPTTSRPEKLTVNHLVHATVSLLPILDNPPAKDSDAVVFYFGLVDARKKLIKQYQGPGAYPGYCLAMSAVQVPVSLFHQVPSGDRKALILEYAKAIRLEYERQAATSCLLSISGLQVETMLQGPPPPAWCGPWYAGDGRGSVHLTPTYTVKGQKVLEIKDFFIGLNKCDPGPFFRATEWNGRIMLSVDFNELAVQTETVQNWMNLWVELLLAL